VYGLGTHSRGGRPSFPAGPARSPPPATRRSVERLFVGGGGPEDGVPLRAIGRRGDLRGPAPTAIRGGIDHHVDLEDPLGVGRLEAHDLPVDRLPVTQGADLPELDLAAAAAD